MAIKYRNKHLRRCSVLTCAIWNIIGAHFWVAGIECLVLWADRKIQNKSDTPGALPSGSFKEVQACTVS